MVGGIIERYQPPAAGDPDHADPHFRPRVRECGRYSRPFETSAAWRYFCPKCRTSTDVRRGLAQTFSATAR